MKEEAFNSDLKAGGTILWTHIFATNDYLITTVQ